MAACVGGAIKEGITGSLPEKFVLGKDLAMGGGGDISKVYCTCFP